MGRARFLMESIVACCLRRFVIPLEEDDEKQDDEDEGEKTSTDVHVSLL